MALLPESPKHLVGPQYCAIENRKMEPLSLRLLTHSSFLSHQTRAARQPRATVFVVLHLPPSQDLTLATWMQNSNINITAQT